MSVNIKVTGGLNIEWGQIDPKVTGGLNDMIKNIKCILKKQSKVRFRLGSYEGLT